MNQLSAMQTAIDDPRVVRKVFYAAQVTPWLNDRRDAEMVGLMAKCLALSAAGVALYFVPYRWQCYAAPLYWLCLVAGLLDRYTLMLHCTSHRPLFKPRYRIFNQIIPCVIGPFFGQTPNTYFVHHLGMHHREENQKADLSSTLAFRRDRIGDWLRYWLRFMLVGVVELAWYLTRRRKRLLLRRVIAGEVIYFGGLALLFRLEPRATLIVFVVPLLLIRTLMMIGNWAQHAFVAVGGAANPHLGSITCINTRYNRRCFNDGYHIGHHLDGHAHWTEYPSQLEQHLDEYGRHDAIVFDGLDFFQVWFLLMTQRWSRLAEAFVRLPGAPLRNRAQVIALLQERVRPVAALG